PAACNQKIVNSTVCRPPISYYECGNPGFIKAKCPKCTLKKVVEMNSRSCPTNSFSSDVPVQSTPADETETSNLHFHENAEERNDLTVLLHENKNVHGLGENKFHL
ncbi:hypothetical protein NPIL_604481, partial [Nephila pilipes]